MKDKRHGEHMWTQWEGEGYFSDTHSELVYFTTEHVDMDNEVVRRALASALQRDGVADGLGGGFAMIAEGKVDFGWAGTIEEERELTVCDEDGETEYGDVVKSADEYTWIEF